MKYEKRELDLFQNLISSDKTEEEVSKFRHALIQSLNTYAEKSIREFAGDMRSDFVHNQLSNVMNKLTPGGSAVNYQKTQEHRIPGIPEQHYENVKRHREEFEAEGIRIAKEKAVKIERAKAERLKSVKLKKNAKTKKPTVKSKIFDLLEKRFGISYFTHKDLLATLLVARGVNEKPEDYNWRTQRGIYAGAISAYNSDYFYSPGRDGRWLEKSTSKGYCLKGRRYDD